MPVCNHSYHITAVSLPCFNGLEFIPRTFSEHIRAVPHWHLFFNLPPPMEHNLPLYRYNLLLSSCASSPNFLPSIKWHIEKNGHALILKKTGENAGSLWSDVSSRDVWTAVQLGASKKVSMVDLKQPSFTFSWVNRLGHLLRRTLTK